MQSTHHNRITRSKRVRTSGHLWHARQADGTCNVVQYHRAANKQRAQFDQWIARLFSVAV